MPLIKGKDLKEKRIPAGCMVKFYPIQSENDLMSWSVVRRTIDMDKKWEAQLHSHPDYEEYWFVIKGKGQIINDNVKYDVEPGDLVITPAGVSHKVKGDITFICCAAKHNANGKAFGTMAQYVAHDKPYRDNPETRPQTGICLEEDITTNY